MALADPQLAEWVQQIKSGPHTPARELGADGLRATALSRAAERPAGPELPDVREVRIGAGQIPGRLYRPAVAERPLIVFLHGGFWILGDLDSHDRTARLLALTADAAVLAVHYRRAPEAKWPAAVDDAVEAVRWATSRAELLDIDPTRVAVAGDSAGGNLAALAALRLRLSGAHVPRAMLLAYPNLDLALTQPSVLATGSGWGLEAEDLAWAVEQWLPAGIDPAAPEVSPLSVQDLHGLPPALVVTAEYDPLRDEGDVFAAALAAAGVPVVHRCEAGMVHGFLQGVDLISPAAAAASERFFADARKLVHG